MVGHPDYPAELCLLELASSLPLSPRHLIMAGRAFTSFWRAQRIQWNLHSPGVINIWPESRKPLFNQDGAAHHLLHNNRIPVAPFMVQTQPAPYFLDWTRCYAAVQFAAVYDSMRLEAPGGGAIPIINFIWASGPHDIAASWLPLPMTIVRHLVQ